MHVYIKIQGLGTSHSVGSPGIVVLHWNQTVSRDEPHFNKVLKHLPHSVFKENQIFLNCLGVCCFTKCV